MINPIRNQGQCGSCYAFSAIGVLEANIAIHKQIMYDLSEQQIVDCSKFDYGNDGCNGGMMTWGLGYLAANGNVL